MTHVLPKRLELSMAASPAQIVERVMRFAIGVHEFLASIPTFEFKTIVSDGGDYPLYVETQTRQPLGVVRLRSYVAADPARRIVGTGIAWAPSDKPDQPGIVITELDGAPGPAAGEEIAAVLLIFGGRG